MKPLWSLNSLGWKLGIEAKGLEDLARSAARCYRPYLKKRSGKKPRLIANPSPALKCVQRKIYRLLLRPIQFPEHLHGGMKGRSPWTNALQHLARPYVIKLDIRDFFPSITDRQVYVVWQRLGYGLHPAGLLTALTTFRARLPQGAPTSSSLANLVLLDPDSELQQRAAAVGCEFTRFVDDLALSGDRPQGLVEAAVRLLREAGFRVSHRKLVVMPGSELQELTGFSVNSPHGPSVPRYRRSRVRAAIHQLPVIYDDELAQQQLRSTVGRIEHIARTNPGSASALRRQLAAHLPKPPAF